MNLKLSDSCMSMASRSDVTTLQAYVYLVVEHSSVLGGTTPTVSSWPLQRACSCGSTYAQQVRNNLQTAFKSVNGIRCKENVRLDWAWLKCFCCLIRTRRWRSGQEKVAVLILETTRTALLFRPNPYHDERIAKLLRSDRNVHDTAGSFVCLNIFVLLFSIALRG
jgi:hypothetical protein